VLSRRKLYQNEQSFCRTSLSSGIKVWKVALQQANDVFYIEWWQAQYIKQRALRIASCSKAAARLRSGARMACDDVGHFGESAEVININRAARRHRNGAGFSPEIPVMLLNSIDGV
jgi:hypothetical protein